MAIRDKKAYEVSLTANNSKNFRNDQKSLT